MPHLRLQTRVLTHRIAHLIHAHGAQPWQVLAITFTNKVRKDGYSRRLLEKGCCMLLLAVSDALKAGHNQAASLDAAAAAAASISSCAMSCRKSAKTACPVSLFRIHRPPTR